MFTQFNYGLLLLLVCNCLICILFQLYHGPDNISVCDQGSQKWCWTKKGRKSLTSERRQVLQLLENVLTFVYGYYYAISYLLLKNFFTDCYLVNAHHLIKPWKKKYVPTARVSSTFKAYNFSLSDSFSFTICLLIFETTNCLASEFESVKLAEFELFCNEIQQNYAN